MAIAFPAAYKFSTRSNISKPSNIRAYQTESGALRLIDLGDTTQYKMTMLIELLTVSERDTLSAWMETNKNAEIDLTVGGQTYRGHIDPRTAIKENPETKSPIHWAITFGFVGVKQ